MDNQFKETLIGRLYTVHPNQDECMLLSLHAAGKCAQFSAFQQLRIAKGVTHATFLSACQAQNLLEKDRHWDVFINDMQHVTSKSNLCIVCNHIDCLFSFISIRVMGEI